MQKRQKPYKAFKRIIPQVTVYVNNLLSFNKQWIYTH